MEVFDAVRTVLAVRQYQDKPVPEPLVHQIVEAGHLTASSNNGQPWHFIVVEDKEMLPQLGALVRTGPYIAQAPPGDCGWHGAQPLCGLRCESSHSIHDPDCLVTRHRLKLDRLR